MLTPLLGLLIALTPLGTDLLLPALPLAAAQLAATISSAQMAITMFFAGIALGQLVWGPVSDGFGRRPVLFAGLGLGLLASLACAFATSIEWLAIWRLAQGLGMSAGPVIARSIVRDLHSHERAARLLASATIVFGIVPILAPLAGAAMLSIGWRAPFWAHALVLLALLIVIARRLHETLPAGSTAADFAGTVTRMRRIAVDRRFLAPFVTVLSVQIGIFAFVAGSAFTLINGLGVSAAAFGMLFAVVMLGQIAGAWANRRLVTRIGIAATLRTGSRLACISGLAALAASIAGINHWSAMVVPTCVYMFAAGFVIPAGTAAALTPFPDSAGAASSLMGATQFACGALISLLVGISFDGTTLPLAALLASGGACAWMCDRHLLHGVLASRRDTN